ncbi:MAG: M20 family metallo-hydrolase [Sphingobacterium sp.]
MNDEVSRLMQDSLRLLQELIQIPSFSKQEAATADTIAAFLDRYGIPCERVGNNLIAYTKFFQKDRPVILLNSHHDTVKPNPGYTRDPFTAEVVDGKLYGLGSNDAGGCLVSLIAAFRYFYAQPHLPFNLCLIASAEEEISGRQGLELAYAHAQPCDFAIVGEPTLLNLAVAEKGLMVLDCESVGRSGHAARDEGLNAIYEAMGDIAWFRAARFEKQSEFLGPVKMSVTMIDAGSQHNVVPASCKFVVDVRTTELYANTDVLAIIREHVKCSVKPRSTRLNSSSIPVDHPIVRSGRRLGKELYGSPTMSDQAVLSIPSLKVGPGDSARSHTADEFIYVREIEEGIQFYIELLTGLS